MRLLELIALAVPVVLDPVMVAESGAELLGGLKPAARSWRGSFPAPPW